MPACASSRRVGDVHRHLVGHHELVAGATGFVDRLRRSARAGRGTRPGGGRGSRSSSRRRSGRCGARPADDPLGLVLLLGADGQARIADDPDRRRRLHRRRADPSRCRSRRRRRSKAKCSPWKLVSPVGPELAQNGQTLLEDPGPLLEIETDARRTRGGRPLPGCPSRCRGWCGRRRAGRASPIRARGRAGCGCRRPCRRCRA